MHQKGNASKRQLFVDRMTAQQPIKLTNMTVASSGTIFLNKGASIEDVPTHVINFKFVPQEPLQVTKETSLQKLTSGMFNACGPLKWRGEAHIPSEKTKQMVRDSTFRHLWINSPLSTG